MNQKEKIQLPSAPIQKNMDLLAEREVVGLGKYGVTLGDAGLSRSALLQHGLEEALDLANYLQTALMLEKDSTDWHAEHRLLMEKLQAFKRKLLSGPYEKINNAPADFIDLMYEYSIEAARRGVFVCP